MNPYALDVLPQAREDIASLQGKDRSVILDALRIIHATPYREGTRLTDDMAGYRRLKKGRHRVFYRVDEDLRLIRILFIGFRKEGDRNDAYRLFRKFIGGKP